MAQSLVVRVLRLTEQARIPAFAHANDLGADLYASESLVLEGQGIGMVPTGIALEMPPELGAIVEDRSGLATRGFVTLGGVVDPDYRGEIRVIVANLGKEPFAVQYGARIAQLRFVKRVDVVFEEVRKLSKTLRGERGFGSTG